MSVAGNNSFIVFIVDFIQRANAAVKERHLVQDTESTDFDLTARIGRKIVESVQPNKKIKVSVSQVSRPALPSALKCYLVLKNEGRRCNFINAIFDL